MEENRNIPSENPPQSSVPAPPFTGAKAPDVPRITFPMGKPELVFGVLILAFSLLVCNSLFYAGANLGFAAGITGTILCTWGFLHSKGHRADSYTATLLVLSLVIAASFARSDDGVMKFFMVVLLLGVPSLAFCLMAGQSRRNAAGVLSLLDGPRALFALGFGQMGAAATGIHHACAASGAIGRRSRSVILGLLLAVPLLAVLVPLLMFADAAFEGLMDLLPELRWGEAAVTALFGFFLGFVLYTRGAALHHLPRKETACAHRKGLSAITVNTVLIAAALVYLTYLLSQLAYFVGGFSGILPKDYTLAAYARRGFFEMAWLCAINLSLITLAMGLSGAADASPLSTRLLCLFIGAVTLFLVAAASAKMLLYIRSYGLTRLRVLTESFMVFLAVTTVIVCIWLFQPKLAYMKTIMIVLLCMCAALMIFDVDTQVARYNVSAYRSGRLSSVDISHLRSLNHGAIAYLAELADDENPQVSRQAVQALHNYHGDGIEDLRHWNLARSQGQQILEETRDQESSVISHVSAALDIAVPNGAVIAWEDTHGGFHGDGQTYAQIHFTSGEHWRICQEFDGNSSWRALPLSDPVHDALYGGESGGISRSPLLCDAHGSELLPEITNGFWFCCDRHTDAMDPHDETMLWNRSAFNFTLAVYDSDAQTLYFFQLDT